MLFNSHEFVFLFLPASFVLFWYGGRSLRWRLGLLTAASYAFYSWWQFDSWTDAASTFYATDFAQVGRSLWRWRFTIIMLASSSVDYWAARWIVALPPEAQARRRGLLAVSLAFNLGLLALFKYSGFFTRIASDLVEFAGGGPLPIVSLILPVGISFYTFESMSYVVDVYRGVARPARSYLDYACFISFFPHLVAGPIIRYSDILHQFQDVNWVRRDPDWDHVDSGLLFLTAGMIKKVLIADRIAWSIAPLWEALARGEPLGLSASWAAVLGYTFRIYFDFSGYSDMAVGLGHLFGVRLPQNFNSPYKAQDPIDFWRRWHITLSTWLRDYLYIPLGGNRRRQVRNLLVTMLLGGLWHGAAWLFVIWGAWHGLLLIGFHQLKQRGWTLSNEMIWGRWVNRQATFLMVVAGWVFFRAADYGEGRYGWSSIVPAVRMFGGMVGRGGAAAAAVPTDLWIMIAASWLWCNFAPNTTEFIYDPRVRRSRHAVAAGVLLAVCVLKFGAPVDFLYFRF